MNADNTPLIDDGNIRSSIGCDDQLDNELDMSNVSCANVPCCNPRSISHRLIALILMCLLGFGSYFCYDNPGALQEMFKRELNITTTQFTMIYSVYSWPNVFLCFVGGFLIDRFFGIRMGTILYLGILLIGQLIFSAGGLLEMYSLLIFGRFIFGIGAESLAVAQNSYAVLWFKGKELNMVFGLQMSIARFGSTVNFWVMQPIYNWVHNYYPTRTLGAVLLLATTTCVVSLICALILGWMDKRAETLLRRNINPSGQLAKLSDVRKFQVPFWIVSLICVAYYVSVFPFVAIGKAFFMKKFRYTPDQANNINSMVYLVSALSSPFFGFIIDKVGYNITWIFLSTLATTIAHCLLVFTEVNPYVGMILMGVGYSMLAASLWPLVALIVPEYQLCTAYGFCQSVQNLGLALITILVGIIIDKSDGEYFGVGIFFISCLLVALLCCFAIYLHDYYTKGILNLSPTQRCRLTGLNTPSPTNITDREPLLSN